MDKINIPYQNHINKQLFDYVISCCNQLNNVNYATDFNDPETEEDNQVYLCFKDNKAFLFIGLSYKDEKEYKPLVQIWTELYDVTIDENLSFLNLCVFKFNIKKFHSLLSFASDYKDRDNILLRINNNKNILCYDIKNTTINVDLAVLLSEESKIYNNILNSWVEYYVIRNLENTEKYDLSVTNVDKNSFLLPYFNHKNSLNFTVSSNKNKSFVLVDSEDKQRIETALCTDDGIKFSSSVLLREDKFKLNENISGSTLKSSPGLWQTLVILQNSKIWETFETKDNWGKLKFKNDHFVYHIFNESSILLDLPESVLTHYPDLELVGKLHAKEIFLLNKLFTNSKNSYFDFSLQKFIGNNYVFGDVPNEYHEVDLTEKCNNELPLKLSFTELKYYIGSDLSQKDFVLTIKTDGINVAIEKWNNAETLMECCVVFNHELSKQYLGV